LEVIERAARARVGGGEEVDFRGRSLTF